MEESPGFHRFRPGARWRYKYAVPALRGEHSTRAMDHATTQCMVQYATGIYGNIGYLVEGLVVEALDRACSDAQVRLIRGTSSMHVARLQVANTSDRI